VTSVGTQLLTPPSPAPAESKISLSTSLNLLAGEMEADGTIAVIPKAENIFVHTGNIVNWNRLKGTVSKSATTEVTRC